MNTIYVEYKYQCIYGTYFNKKASITFQLSCNLKIKRKLIKSIINQIIDYRDECVTKLILINNY